MSYRSKLELTENVRIVEIEGLDKCACCAPHVRVSGEVGMIKITEFLRYKGGMRLHILCGFDALYDYRRQSRDLLAISNLLSAKRARKRTASSAFLPSFTHHAPRRRLSAGLLLPQRLKIRSAPTSVFAFSLRISAPMTFATR